MKLENREPVKGTSPVIYIGHRYFRDRKTGLKKISRKWHAEFNYLGRKHHRPLRTTNIKTAIKAAWAIVERLQEGESDPTPRKVTWEQMKEQYMRFQNDKGRAPKTLQKYVYVIGQLVRFAIEDRHRSDPTKLTASDFWAFNEKMRQAGLSAKTRADRLTIVKQWFKWANTGAKPKLLLDNAVSGEEVPDAPSAPQPCFTPEQVATLLKTADPDHEGPIYAALAYLGLRFGEARDLRWSDFHLPANGAGSVTIRRGGSGDQPKDKQHRQIPVHPELRKILDRLPKRPGGRVFAPRPSAKYPEGNGPLDERRLLMSLKRLCRRCGFENPTQFKLHTFRHVFASMLARKNISYKYALGFLGHSQSEVFDMYFKQFDETAQQAIQSISYTDGAVS